jgi:HK97 gp10 family phage protein
MIRIECSGADGLIARLDKMAQADIHAALQESVEVVERTAKKLAPVDSGQLQGSIRHDVEGDTGKVYTNVVYAPYVEYGTGVFNGGDGKYWVFVKGSPSGGPTSHKRYTLEEAKQIVARMREEGLDAWYTNGQKPQPYMHPALFNNQRAIAEIFDKHVKETMT